jgi:predicted lipoprotein with Yx(FWY)xxD motif
MKRMILGLTAALFVTGAAIGGALAAEPAKYMDSSLGKVLVDNEKSMTLYTYKPDGTGAKLSTCTGKCIVAWPPFLAAADAKAEGDWTIVDVVDKDGKTVKMWAYDAKPLYWFVKDTKPGDVTGEGLGDVWYVVKED